MARPTKITNQQILDAASRLILERGPSVPSAQIAKAAGVSEGTLFKRFGSKDELFLQALGAHRVPNLNPSDYVGTGSDVAEPLAAIAERLIDFFQVIVPRIMMINACTRGMDPRDLLRRFKDPPPLRVMRLIIAFLDGEIALGRLRPCDAEIAARMFQGALHGYVVFDMVGLNQIAPMPRATFVRGVVGTLLDGLRDPRFDSQTGDCRPVPAYVRPKDPPGRPASAAGVPGSARPAPNAPAVPGSARPAPNKPSSTP